MNATTNKDRMIHATDIAKSISKSLFTLERKKIPKKINTSYDSLGRRILLLKKALAKEHQLVIIGHDYSQVPLQQLALVDDTTTIA